MKLAKIIKLIISILICQLAGVIGSIVTVPAVDSWYIDLKKPFFTPPSWVFAPVWTILYLLMGIALYLIWSKVTANREFKEAIKMFSVQLVLNVSWSVVFFGSKSPLLGMLVIIVLWVAIALTIKKFNKISKLAGSLLIPYILWVSYAILLNLSIWWLN